MIAGTAIEDILLAILKNVGIPALVQWLVAQGSQAQIQAILTAEYAAAGQAADAEAAQVLKP
jgi:hypothetical protein